MERIEVREWDQPTAEERVVRPNGAIDIRDLTPWWNAVLAKEPALECVRAVGAHHRGDCRVVISVPRYVKATRPESV